MRPRKRLPESGPYDCLVVTVFPRLMLAVERLGRRLLAMDMWKFVLVIAAIAALKSTFFWRGSFFYAETEAFPKPVTHFSSNFLAIALHRISEPFVSVGFLGASVIALASAIWLFIVYVSREISDNEDRRIVIILGFTWPAVMVVLPWIGNGTAFLPLFVLIAMMSRSRLLSGLGLLLAIATHPEHTFVGFALLAVLTSRPEFRRFRKRAFIATVVSLACVLLVTVWLSSEASPSRAGALSSGVEFAFPFALRHGILGVYTWWGLWWLVLAAVLVVTSIRTRWLVFSVGVVVPGIFTAITADYTRVFVGITIPLSIAFVTVLISRNRPQSGVEPENAALKPGLALGSWFVVLILLPNLIFMMPGDGVPTPGMYWVGLLQNFVLPQVP